MLDRVGSSSRIFELPHPTQRCGPLALARAGHPTVHGACACSPYLNLLDGVAL